MQQLLEQTAPEVDDVLMALANVSGMPSVLITHVDDVRWQVLAALTTDPSEDLSCNRGQELPVGKSFCHEVFETGAPVVVSDAAFDERFRDHPAFRELGVVSYVGVPFRLGNGPVLGALCALDRRPHVGLDRVVPHFELLARLLSHELRWADEARSSLAALQQEAEIAAARERFLASVAHDLRTPLAAIRMSAHLVARQAHVVDRVNTGIGRVLHSADRMARLIDDLLDFARGRLGTGIPIVPERITDVRRFLGELLEETAAAFTGRPMRWTIELDDDVCVAWDRDRIAQCVENLVGNACEHGAPDAPVIITVSASEEDVQLEIVNGGELIPGRVSNVDPFGPRSGRRGLGLGLFIADRVARAHGGALSLVSNGGQTRTILTIPREAPALRGSAA
jgi:signal transduction histidine kinase